MVDTQENDADSKQLVCVPVVEEKRLVVRLKIPKKKDQNIGFEQKNANNQLMMITYNGERACEICGKVLKSGKAVGGHMRIHVQPSKKKDVDYTEKASKKKRVYKSSSTGDDNINRQTCSICSKRFPSKKSLYGHMKSHPNRHWRGITPPSSSSSLKVFQPKIGDEMKNLDGGEKNGTVDLLNELWSWKVSGRRGRGSVGSMVLREEDEQEDEDIELVEAAKELMLMANGAGHESEKLMREYPNEVEKGNLLRGKSVELMDKEPENTNSKVVIKKRRKKAKLSDLTLEQSGEDKYKCLTCGKSFPTFQALGGHRSSHSTNFKIVNQKPFLCLTAPVEETENNGAKGVSSITCDYKEIHGIGTVEASASHVEPPGESSQRVLGLDLNEMP